MSCEQTKDARYELIKLHDNPSRRSFVVVPYAFFLRLPLASIIPLNALLSRLSSSFSAVQLLEMQAYVFPELRIHREEYPRNNLINSGCLAALRDEMDWDEPARRRDESGRVDKCEGGNGKKFSREFRCELPATGAIRRSRLNELSRKAIIP